MLFAGAGDGAVDCLGRSSGGAVRGAGVQSLAFSFVFGVYAGVIFFGSLEFDISFFWPYG